MANDEHEAAWNAVHEALLPGWRVGRPEQDPTVHRWRVVAWSGRGRNKIPEEIEGEGEDELGALRDLASWLRLRSK